MSEDKKECIVVAEDSPPNRKILVHLLEKLGYEVVSCEDGQLAWDHLNSSQDSTNIVAVLSDIMMPNMDGLELLKSCRSDDRYKEIPFVLITAVSDREYIIEAKEQHVNGYILKPVTFQRVTSKLKELFPDKKFDLAKAS